MSFISKLFFKKDDKNIISKDYKLNNLVIKVQVEAIGSGTSHVYIERFIKTEFLPNGIEHTPRQMISAAEFFADIEKLIKFINRSSNLDNNAIYNALGDICREHIIKFKRLIAIDLRAYVLTTLQIVDAISVARSGKHIDNESGVSIRDNMIRFIHLNFDNYIVPDEPTGGLLSKLETNPDSPFN